MGTGKQAEYVPRFYRFPHYLPPYLGGVVDDNWMTKKFSSWLVRAVLMYTAFFLLLLRQLADYLLFTPFSSHYTEKPKTPSGGAFDLLERVTGVEPVSSPWQGLIIAAIRYPLCT